MLQLYESKKRLKVFEGRNKCLESLSLENEMEEIIYTCSMSSLTFSLRGQRGSWPATKKEQKKIIEHFFKNLILETLKSIKTK